MSYLISLLERKKNPHKIEENSHLKSENQLKKTLVTTKPNQQQIQNIFRPISSTSILNSIFRILSIL